VGLAREITARETTTQMNVTRAVFNIKGSSNSKERPVISSSCF
jgi:hypothetical protein